MLSPLSETSMEETGLLPALISDYLSQKDSIRHLYKYPFDIASFRQVIADKSKDKPDRETLVAVLKKQYVPVPTTKAVTENIEALLSEKTFTLATAHQPALLLGPLYYIYKISSVINLAKQLAVAYPEYRFVPVFWMGSEDHDIEELNHTFINGKKITWTCDGKGAIGRLKFATLQPVLEELKSLGVDAHIIHILEEGIGRYENFGSLTQYLINELFKDHGLVILNQDDVSLKKIFSPVIRDEILNSRATSTLKENITFLETNYKLQANPRDINFFYLGENSRERIVFNPTSSRFEVNHTSLSFTREEIIVETEQHPDRFSPNVIFRPLFQEMILPNLAFVGGSGELSYWLELKPLFDHYGVNYPMQILRSSAAIISPPVQKKMEKLGLQPEDFFHDIEALINRYVQQHLTTDISLEEEKQQLEILFERIIQKAASTDITLKQSAASEKQKALTSLQHLEAKMLKAEKKKQETAVSQIRSIHNHLFPEQTLQERRENFIPFYSPDFIQTCVSNLNPFRRTFNFFLSVEKQLSQ